MKTKKEETLTFENLYTVRGLYTDGKGNEFYVYISGEKKEVDKFRRYQEHQRDKKGVFGIRATVSKDDSSSTPDANQLHQQKSNKKVKKTEFVAGKVRIGISRHKIVIKKPYKVTYFIDPKTPVPGNTDTDIPAFQIELDGTKANVDCKVTKGAVTFQMSELGTVTTVAAGPITLTDQEGNNKGNLSATGTLSTVRWQVTAKQAVAPKIPNIKPQPSVFELEYTKHF